MNKYWLAILAFPLLIFTACQEEDVIKEQEEVNPDPVLVKEIDTVKLAVYDIMHEWYLWNVLIPEVNIEDYASADELMKAMMNKTLDKWSYIEDEEEYNALFEKGEYQGYGLRMAFDEDGNLRVAFVYNDSPFGRAGVQRSWIINKIDGKNVKDLSAAGTLAQALEGTSHDFELIRSDGSKVNELLTKTTIGINTVLNDDIFQLGQTKVGYLAFNSFLATSEDELRVSFQKFKDENIQEMIIDLRYNGGGRVNIAEWMASNIIGDLSSGKNFIQYRFNQNKAAENDAQVPFNTPEIPLNLDRVIFITSNGSASASELLINGLRPFIDVQLIGDDTYGKPVGSFPFKVNGYAINPISFKVLNDQGVGEYFEGLQADAYIKDDLTHDLGDPNEARLKEALYFIENGTFSGLSARQSLPVKEQQIEMKGFRMEIGAF
ncbi:carboxyl-terminal processing protease [Catalinimonas alkaloidigena]|uniref:S41 family peptidase n=1 Tax=Catalinimonas alkaloidigena TaxID=1075417 RepID=UPI002404BAC2|nr:S41 family peptidase [Catalinimonas alkaloidigena]MDF9797344.1 carboxyl-terminal processing protease [Catalinimonas alkaloidigena]